MGDDVADVVISSKEVLKDIACSMQRCRHSKRCRQPRRSLRTRQIPFPTFPLFSFGNMIRCAYFCTVKRRCELLRIRSIASQLKRIEVKQSFRVCHNEEVLT